VNVSQVQAIQIATDQALNKYSFLSNSTILDNIAMAGLSLQDRGNYILYPSWDIILPLAKPVGAVGEIQVLLWADTGQVYYIVGSP
jgi:hypothetical protein